MTCVERPINESRGAELYTALRKCETISRAASMPDTRTPDTFYKTFSEKKLTTYGSARRGKIEQHRLALLHRHKAPPGEMFEIGPGHGTLAEQAVAAGWSYTAIEASPILVDVLRKKGLTVIESWTPPIPIPDGSADVIYADQVLEHMSGIDDARSFTAE